MLRIWQLFIKNDTKITSRINRWEYYDFVKKMNRSLVGLLSLESCCGRPKMRNSVLKGLRDRKLDDIQLDTLLIVFSRWLMLWENDWLVFYGTSTKDLSIWANLSGGLLAQAFEDSQRGTYNNNLHAKQWTYTCNDKEQVCLTCLKINNAYRKLHDPEWEWPLSYVTISLFKTFIKSSFVYMCLRLLRQNFV